MVATNDDIRKYPRTGKRGAPQVFPRKLFELLQKEDRNVITWDEEGETFVIQDMDTFTRESLERYFKHHKFTSFQRQLNLYGFRKIAKGERMGYYVHPHFQRDHPEWLSKVRRTPQPGKSTPRTSPTPQVPKPTAKKMAPPAPSLPTMPMVASGPTTVSKPPPIVVVKKQEPSDDEDDYSLARTVTNFFSQAVGLLDPGLSPSSADSDPDGKDEYDEQGNPLRRSKRRQARRIREHSFQIMQLQQRQHEMEAADLHGFPSTCDSASPQPVSQQPGMDDESMFFPAPALHRSSPRNSGAVTKLRRMNTDDAFMTAIEAAFDFADFDTMDLAADPSNAGLFTESATEADVSAPEERLTLGARGGQHRARSGELTGEIEDLWGDNGDKLGLAPPPAMRMDSMDIDAELGVLDTLGDLDGGMDVDIYGSGHGIRETFGGESFGFDLKNESFPALTIMER